MEYEPNLDRSLDLFIRKLKDLVKSRPQQPVDVSAWLQFWTFDALGEVNFSRPMGFLDAGEDIDGICQLDHDMMVYFANVTSLFESCLPMLTFLVGSNSSLHRKAVRKDIDMDKGFEAKSSISCMSV